MNPGDKNGEILERVTQKCMFSFSQQLEEVPYTRASANSIPGEIHAAGVGIELVPRRQGKGRIDPKIWACPHQDGVWAVRISLCQTEKLALPMYGRKETD